MVPSGGLMAEYYEEGHTRRLLWASRTRKSRVVVNVMLLDRAN
jgi:hypothetical protein